MMNQLLKEFWKWANLTPYEYADGLCGRDGRIAEDEFDHFVALLSCAKQIVDEKCLSVERLDELITIMALDNESETILEYIVENASKEQIEQITSIGMVHLQSQARWQIAEIIFRRKPRNYIDRLRFLAQDDCLYVRKRAQNILLTRNTGDGSLCYGTSKTGDGSLCQNGGAQGTFCDTGDGSLFQNESDN